MKTRFKINESLLIYTGRRKSISFSRRLFICLFLVVLFLTFPLFISVNPYERLLDASFSKDLALKISLLKK